MKLGKKSILASAIAGAMVSGAALATAPTTGPYVEVKNAADYPSWEVSSEKLAALSGDYQFEDNGTIGENNAALVYKTDIDLNDGDKITFNFGSTALLKGADFELVLADGTGTTIAGSEGSVYGVRISAVDTTNGVAEVKVRIANAGATGIPAGSILALVEAGTTGTSPGVNSDLGDLTLTAPGGTWTSSACVEVTATDVVGDSLPGATVGNTCVLEFSNQFGLDPASLTDLTAKIDVAQDRKTYVEQTTVPTADGEEAVANDVTGTLSSATYIISNSASLDDFITFDATDTVVYTFTDTSEWTAEDAPTFNGGALSTVTDSPELRTYTSTGGFASGTTELVYDVDGTTGTDTLAPHTVSAKAVINFTDGGSNDGLASVSIEGADLYNVGINGSTSKVASFTLNPSTSGFFSWVEIANESGDAADVEVDVVIEGMTYKAVKLGSVAGETVRTIGHAEIQTALEAAGATVNANAKVTLTFVVTAKEDKVQVSGMTKGPDGRTTLDVYYQDGNLDRKWRN
ncbi:hypothetical protein [Pseudoalteromonas piratica]|uniref:Uncharacterized protein n=1 Tax=Pseudoalteromonas piratica TaxID=1348114 RepID=A0A0A7EEU5_9GAMM|nr:hypothetical protein [Pseudoalteromonas piratica]AIY64586.1 hypothetical protein OM33_05045 [Pseudoalteromonas piratica]